MFQVFDPFLWKKSAYTHAYFCICSDASIAQQGLGIWVGTKVFGSASQKYLPLVQGQKKVCPSREKGRKKTILSSFPSEGKCYLLIQVFIHNSFFIKYCNQNLLYTQFLFSSLSQSNWPQMTTCPVCEFTTESWTMALVFPFKSTMELSKWADVASSSISLFTVSL